VLDLKKLETVEKRYEELNNLLMQPDVISDYQKYQKLAKEQADVSPLIEKITAYKKVITDMEGAEELLRSGDPEMKELAQAELAELREREPALEQELMLMLIPKDPRDEKNVILEIRAGTGGEEAGLFAANLFRMYSKYAESRRWKVAVIDSSPTGVGGLKEIVASVEGTGAYSRLKYESGVHRVQRVPVTETQGRIHTSAATVAVLPEAEDVDVKVAEKDLPVPGRALADKEQGQGHEGPPLEAIRARDGNSGEGACRSQEDTGGHRRPQRAHPHLQLPAEQGHRPPRGPHPAQARQSTRRRARRGHRHPSNPLRDREAKAAEVNPPLMPYT
jgi:protein subunit release factor A